MRHWGLCLSRGSFGDRQGGKETSDRNRSLFPAVQVASVEGDRFPCSTSNRREHQTCLKGDTPWVHVQRIAQHGHAPAWERRGVTPGHCRLRVFFIVDIEKQTQNPYCLSGEAATQNLVLLHYFEPRVKDLESFWMLPSSDLLMALLYLLCC